MIHGRPTAGEAERRCRATAVTTNARATERRSGEELVWHELRLACPNTGCAMQSWTLEDRRIAAPRMALTDRAGRWVTMQVGRFGRTVNEVAVELGCDWHTINDTVIAATLLEKNGSVQKTIRSGVFDIGYRTDGRGTPLLLLGGWSMKADQWWESGYVDALRDQFAVIAVDRIGHGQSDKPHDASAYEESLVIRDLVAILDAEGVDRALVWGFSMGAATAAELATRHPERVFALVCAGGGPFPAAPDHEERILNLSEAVATVAGFADMMRAFGVDDEGIAEIEGRNDLVALSLSLRATAHWSPAAAGIRCPMMWYVGSEDLGGFCPADLELADRHGFEAFEIEGATHASSFTDAAIPLASVIPFLQRHADPLGER